MQPSKIIKTFTEHHPYIGPLFWIVSVQYYISQIIVAAAWTIIPYNWTNNTISDLGNTVCGQYGERFVCSPKYALMNVSFILLGLTMILGAVLIYQGFMKTRASLIGFSFMAISGIGTLLVGLFPENSINGLHILGAFLAFLIGNLGLVILGYALDIPKSLKYYTLFSGFLALTATILFVTHIYLGLGIGGIERIATYPQTMWLIVFGVYISSSHMREERSR